MLYLFLADGFEETEALVPLDCIRRAGIPIMTVGVGTLQPTGTRGVTVISDISSDEIDLTDCDGILLPGGMPGTENLFRDAAVTDALTFCAENGLLVASICAAPSIPGRLGFLREKKAVCFPGFEAQLKGAVIAESAVITDGNFITAKGAGCVFPFAHAIITYLGSAAAADTVLQQMQYAQL